MGKITNASEEYEKIFEEVLSKKNIPHWVEFRLLCDTKMKKAYRIKKTDESIEFLTDGVNIIMHINEEILDQLPDNFKKMAIDECLEGVFVNENDVIKINQPNIYTHSGMLIKYDNSDVIAFKESINSLIESIAQQEKEMRQSKKKNKS